MKTFLLSLGMLLLSLTGIKAEVVFDFSDPATWGYAVPGTGAGVDLNDNATFTKEGIDIAIAKGSATNNPRFWGNADGTVEMRLYNGSKLTITATTAFTEITFAGKDVAGMTPSTGTFSNGVWTGEATTVVFSMTKTTKIQSVTVSASADMPVVAAPVLSPGVNMYTTPIDVTMTCATEGAVIKYTLNDGAEQTYTTPVHIAETTVVKAYAQKGTDKSATVEYYYQIIPADGIDNVLAFYDLDVNAMVKFNCPLRVTYQYGAYLYVEDADKNHMLIYEYNAPRYNPGDLIPAGVEGVVNIYQEVKQLRPTLATLGEATPGTVITTVMTTDQLNSLDLVHRYIEVRNASIADNTLTDDKGSIEIYNKYKITLPTDGVKRNYVGIMGYYSGSTAKKYQFFPIGEASATGLNEVTAKVNLVYGAQGVIRIEAPVGAQVNVFNQVGAMIINRSIQAGLTDMAVTAGVYVVKVNDEITKVVVE